MLKFPIDRRKRRILQWSLLSVVLVTISLGWKFPFLGFSVPVVMIAGILISLFRGRMVCGNFCPRGSFFDRIVSSFSQKTSVPPLLRDMRFRWSMFALLMGFMVFRLAQNPLSLAHWGHVFWVMCVVTTALGLVLGIVYHPRTWCAFCPMGTLQNALGGEKQYLAIDSSSCRSCKLCEKKCPFDLSIVAHKNTGKIVNPDCLKCSECVQACPVNALSWVSNRPATVHETIPLCSSSSCPQ